MALNLTPEQRQAFADALYGGRKIQAIQQLRAISGLDLKESKEIIERLRQISASNILSASITGAGKVLAVCCFSFCSSQRPS